MLRKVFYVSTSLLMLALAYHLGASTATAQAPSNPVVAVFTGIGDNLDVVTANGGVYGAYSNTGPWVLRSNIFSGPTSARQTSWGALKVQSH
jgi:hypothetical protein